MNKVIVFDVETPNRRNDRICSIGLTVICNRRIVDSYYSLVNPECEFDQFNISIHGIRPKDIMHSPVFTEVWDRIGNLFRESLVAAHNAAFDLCVLKKVLTHYKINESMIKYICTMKMAKCSNLRIYDHKLSTLCDYLGIALDHHNAASDSNACAEILCYFMDSGMDLRKHVYAYNLSNQSNSERLKSRN